MNRRIGLRITCGVGLAVIAMLISICGSALESISIPKYDGQHGQSETDRKTYFDGVIDMGCYTYHGKISSECLYADEYEAPFVFIDQDTVRLFFPYWDVYSPWSSGGRHAGHFRQYQYAPSSPAVDGMQLLTDSGIDTETIRSCARYPLHEGELELLLVETDAGKEIWLAEWWKSDLPFVYQIAPTGRYQLQVEDEDGEPTATMFDLTAPPVLNLSDPSLSKKDVLAELKHCAENDDRIVAAKYDEQDGGKNLYRVFEYQNEQLRSWVEYCFYDVESNYQSAKGSALYDNGVCNDRLRLTKVCHGYEVTLWENLCGKTIDEMPAALEQEGFQHLICTDFCQKDSDCGKKVSFEQIRLQNTAAPLLKETPTAIKTLDVDGVHFILYRPNDENTYDHLAVTISNHTFDLGRIGYGNADSYGNSIVQKTAISSQNTIYAVAQREDLDLMKTAYITIRDKVPVFLFSIPGTGTQLDVDGDGELETVANEGLSTWPNNILYEWQIDENSVCRADLCEQLESDTMAFDHDEKRFLAGQSTDRGWKYDHFQYDGTYIHKAHPQPEVPQ